ncbi:glycoside hydrolase family 3 C-terminal domain-containing protein [Mycolicibacterium goodii]|uniref:glycoside hydrolase family 3 C-terminal domain-containing protein n=1 Tax=Mycolicibacterium goodii TaxID=134601 RepID=UPI001BDBD8AA|nr:glycoside hydrolase family 3 C-terminal domain-containing protein [Mycolicibacterium goodii]MBU8819769.1 glycoside hydrolase family 3 C-terminal domain-containing protein [Mycolicibacterium goodii]
MTDPLAQISTLTLIQQAALGSGASFWTTEAVGDIPSIVLTDGPHGVRKQSGASDHLGIGSSEPATCFPPAAALSQTWDPDLIERVGAALGAESRALGVHVLLGPGINIKRDPRCGRNFEYFSEDPLLSGALGAAWVRGVQSRGVGASLKHFAANNSEHDRMRASSDVDARTLREIYLRAFEHVVREAAPWTVMCSYNRINGVYASENTWLLTDVLRGEWGFDGVVVSDWGAVRDRVAAVAAGLDLEMPSSGGFGDSEVVAAVTTGALDAAAVATAAERVARLALRAHGSSWAAETFDMEDLIDAHHRLARQAAGLAVVLLKNDLIDSEPVLPLAPSRLAVIGPFAQEPRYQGGGSSHVNPTRLDVPLDEIRTSNLEHPVTYFPGLPAHPDDDAERLRAHAVRGAAEADTAVLFLGLPADEDSEGYDREHIDLPPEQLALLRAVVEAQPRTVVVLSHGGVVRLDAVAELAPAILDGALLGQAGGGALADILFGAVNPSGRLAETVPARLHDTPAYLNFPSENGHTVYGERIFVGYRWYDVRDLEVTFPFGHGLSYTAFAYSDLEVDAGPDGLTVRVVVANVGPRPGREVVQVYASKPDSRISRAPRWLAGFGSLSLDSGERRGIEIPIRRADLAFWDVRSRRWVVESGDHTVSVGASSQDLRLHATVAVDGDVPRIVFTRESTLGEILADPAAAPLLFETLGTAAESTPAMGTDLLRMLASVPIERMVSLSGGRVTPERLDDLLAALNAVRP